VIGRYPKNLKDMEKSSPNIIVRETVYKKLCKVDEALKRRNGNWQLLVLYGYRSIDIQKNMFNIQYEKYRNEYINHDELIEAVHRIVAVPEVSGHPTGGAVDVTIFNFVTNEMLDFGGEPLVFSSKNVYYDTPNLTENCKLNRKILRAEMGKQGFAPYDGEWWHFSYGDKEWAFYNYRENIRKNSENNELVYQDIISLYDQKKMSEITYTDKYRISILEPAINDVVRLALQKNGRLTTETISLLEKAGIDVVAESDKFFGKCRNFPLELFFVRDDDIPNLVEAGVADIGIVGENIYIEQQSKCRKLMSLGYGRCSLVFAVPNNSPIKTVQELSGKRVATSYRNSTTQFLKEMDVSEVEIVDISGSVEIAPSIGYADAIVDLASTGNSLRQNNLHYLQTIYESQSILIGNDQAILSLKKPTIDKLIQRFEVCLKAKKYKSLVFTCPKEKIEAIRKIDGKQAIIEHKTNLENILSVQLVVEKNLMWDVIDSLKLMELTNILALDVEGFI